MYKKYSIKTTKNKSDAGKTMSDDSQELSTPTTMGTTAPEKLTGTECEQKSIVVETFDDLDLKMDLLKGIYAYGFENPTQI